MADSTTTHYAFVQPQVGASLNTWGTKLNNDLASIDSILWAISAGISQGINAPAASVANIVLTNPLVTQQQIAFTGPSLSLQMPAMNAATSAQVGSQIAITNTGAYAFNVIANDGSTVLYGGGVASGTITGGTLYTAGTYTDVPLTGGSGTGARANIIVSGGAVTGVSITAAAWNGGYKVGDTLSALAANIGGTGSGFLFTLTGLTGLPPGATIIAKVTSNATTNGAFTFAVRGDMFSQNNLLDVQDLVSALNNLLPTQTGNTGKYLGTNGTNASWVASLKRRCRRARSWLAPPTYRYPTRLR